MDMNTVFELHRRGLITDEVLAECLNEKYGQKNVEKTWEEKREELIEKNREQAEANRQKISEYEKKYRDEYYHPDSDRKNIGEVIIAKNRHGETGSVELVWLGEIQKFADKSREM